MASHIKRSILKTVTWRITASLDTFVIAWILTGDWKLGGSIAGIEVLTKMFFIILMKEIGIKLNGVKRSGGNPKRVGAARETRTPMGNPTWPSTKPVYQFQHGRIIQQ